MKHQEPEHLVIDHQDPDGGPATAMGGGGGGNVIRLIPSSLPGSAPLQFIRLVAWYRYQHVREQLGLPPDPLPR